MHVHLICNFQFEKIIQTITRRIQFIEDKKAALTENYFFEIEEIAMMKYIRLTILEFFLKKFLTSEMEYFNLFSAK